MSFYNKIINPETGRKVSIYSKLGNKILNNYFNLFQTGGHDGPCGLNEKGNRCKKSAKWDRVNCELSEKRVCTTLKSTKTSNSDKIKENLSVDDSSSAEESLSVDDIQYDIELAIDNLSAAITTNDISKINNALQKCTELGIYGPIVDKGENLIATLIHEQMLLLDSGKKKLPNIVKKEPSIKKSECDMWKTDAKKEKRISARCYYDTYEDQQPIGDMCSPAWKGGYGCMRLDARGNPRWFKCNSSEQTNSKKPENICKLRE